MYDDSLNIFFLTSFAAAAVTGCRAPQWIVVLQNNNHAEFRQVVAWVTQADLKDGVTEAQRYEIYGLYTQSTQYDVRKRCASPYTHGASVRPPVLADLDCHTGCARGPKVSPGFVLSSPSRQPPVVRLRRTEMGCLERAARDSPNPGEGAVHRKGELPRARPPSPAAQPTTSVSPRFGFHF